MIKVTIFYLLKDSSKRCRSLRIQKNLNLYTTYRQNITNYFISIISLFSSLYFRTNSWVQSPDLNRRSFGYEPNGLATFPLCNKNVMELRYGFSTVGIGHLARNKQVPRFLIFRICVFFRQQYSDFERVVISSQKNLPCPRLGATFDHLIRLYTGP